MQNFNDLSSICFRHLLSFGVIFHSAMLYAESKSHFDISDDSIKISDAKSSLPQENLDELLLELSINQQKAQNVLVLKDQNDQLYFAGDDLELHRINFRKLQPIYYQQQSYYNLKDLEAKIKLDLSQMTVQVELLPRYFNVLQLSGYKENPITMNTAGFGSYLNYDMVTNYSDHSKATTVNGAFDWVIFSPWGSFNHTFVSRNMTHSDVETLRLDSYFRFDDPIHRRTLIVGDTSSEATSWSGSVRFAGLQWGTNYDTQPSFNRLPLMTISGEVLSPSTLDVYVNNALQSQQKVDAGAFSLNDIATVSGNGIAKVVVKDVLGRQQVLTRSFYGNAELLRQGLNEYQFEIGQTRQEYARKNFDYEQLMATATWRRGISRHFTVESHAQLLEDRWMMGLGGFHTLPYATRLGWVYATSYNGEKNGRFTHFSLRKQMPKLSAGLEHQTFSEEFWKLGQQVTHGKIKQYLKMYGSLNLPKQLNLSLNYAQQKYHSKQTSSSLILNLSKILNKRVSVQVFAHHGLEKSNSMIGLGMNISMPDNKGVSIYSSFDDSQAIHSLQLQSNPTTDRGLGYRLQSGLVDAKEQYQATFDYKNNYLTTQLELAHFENAVNMRSSFQGGLSLLDGQIMASRRIEDSFALVHVPSLKNVRFYAENQEIGRTNSEGYGVVPRMRPYQKNQLLIEQADLPMNVDIRSLNMNVSPYIKTGVVVNFPIKIVRDAFFTLVDEQQKQLSLGTILVDENGKENIVGARGEVYLFDVPQKMKLTTKDAENKCAVTVDPQRIEDAEQIPTLICESIL